MNTNYDSVFNTLPEWMKFLVLFNSALMILIAIFFIAIKIINLIKKQL